MQTSSLDMALSRLEVDKQALAHGENCWQSEELNRIPDRIMDVAVTVSYYLDERNTWIICTVIPPSLFLAVATSAIRTHCLAEGVWPIT